ncbi:MAG: metallophosphatase family protein [Acidobacteria bacterium]|nr:metallophosphatase family protein [Acidobacteriota bacterium]
MRYLILSDIHSNLEALVKCLKLAEGRYDQVLCLGDLVGYGPDPNAVIERVRPLARIIVRGNHDKACCGLMDPQEFNLLARLAVDWTRGRLTPENFEFLCNLPNGPVSIDGFELVHGSPADEDEYIFDSLEVIRAFSTVASPLVFFGHTHVQGGFLLTANHRFRPIRTSPETDDEPVSLPLDGGARYLINPGSVGQPRDGDWRAGFAIFDAAARRVDYYRTPYNLEITQRKMRQEGLPEPLIRRLEAGH